MESAYNGDFHSVGDSIDVVLENSAILGNEVRDKDSHALGLYADHVNLTTENSSIAGHALDGIHIESTTTIWNSNQSTTGENGQDGIDINGDLNWNSAQDVISGNGSEGLTVSGALTLDADSTFVTGNGSHGIEALGSSSDVTLYQSQLKDNGGDGVRLTGSGSGLEADYSFVRDNGGDAVEMGSSGTLRMASATQLH